MNTVEGVSRRRRSRLVRHLRRVSPSQLALLWLKAMLVAFVSCMVLTMLGLLEVEVYWLLAALWTVGRALSVVIGVLLGLTQVAALVVAYTAWRQSCST